MNLADLFDLHGLNADELRVALIELCARGLLTCTRGKPGAEDATYALAWHPLDNPEQFEQEVRDRHADNMRRLGFLPTGTRT
ncbi:MAG: hypothetical protein ACSLE2_12840 [Lysobacterales bacterium]